MAKSTRASHACECGKTLHPARKSDYCPACEKAREKDKRQMAAEIMARLQDDELVLAETKRVIGAVVRDELEELVVHVVRRVFLKEVFPVLKKWLAKRKGAASETAVLAEAPQPPVVAEAEPESVVEEAEAQVSLRLCLCCGDPHHRSRSRYCASCSNLTTRRIREHAMVLKLWRDFPDIAAQIVKGLKGAGTWPQ